MTDSVTDSQASTGPVVCQALGRVLHVPPARSSSLCWKTCGWTAVGSDRRLGDPEGLMGDRTGDRRFSEQAG